MSNDLDNDGEYMGDEHEAEDVENNICDELHGRDTDGSDSEIDEHDHMVRVMTFN